MIDAIAMTELSPALNATVALGDIIVSVSRRESPGDELASVRPGWFHVGWWSRFVVSRVTVGQRIPRTRQGPGHTATG
jgi:hypothetical protein